MTRADMRKDVKRWTSRPGPDVQMFATPEVATFSEARADMQQRIARLHPEQSITMPAAMLASLLGEDHEGSK